MSSIIEQIQCMQSFIESNLKEIASEILHWHETGILCDGKFRIACSILTEIVDMGTRQSIVEKSVNSLCLKFVASHYGTN